MKKIISMAIILIMLMGMAIPALASDYRFSSGGDITFGGATTYDGPVRPDPQAENIRRNKDAAALPPPYGIFSGEIPTGQSSPYHNNIRASGPAFAPGGDITDPHTAGIGTGNVATGLLPSTSLYAETRRDTAPRFYEDGSMGTLHVHRLNRTVAVYHGETEENMRRGAGHFEMTSAWDGNVGLAGHNRGSSGHFGFVAELSTGDRITYTTPYGSRAYEVYGKAQIGETDTSGLGWSADNILTLITCLANQPSYRVQVQLREVR